MVQPGVPGTRTRTRISGKCRRAPILARGGVRAGCAHFDRFVTSTCKRIRSFVEKPSGRNGLHVGYSMTQNAHGLPSRAVRKFRRAPQKSSEIPKLGVCRSGAGCRFRLPLADFGGPHCAGTTAAGFLVRLPGGRPRPRLTGVDGASAPAGAAACRVPGQSLGPPKSCTRRTDAPARAQSCWSD
jgi:hypothetical protein